jgi:murein DD-endopeptidase MepM/ murein hydrolase activator NlpD
MDDHYIITIKDDKEVKKYNVHKFVKKAILYAALFLGSIFVLGFGTILYLSLSIDDIEKNRESLKNAYYLLVKESDTLVQKHNTLKKNYRDTKEALQKKREKLEDLTVALNEIETMMGIEKDLNQSVEQRVNAAKISSEHRATILQFIPNGAPIVYKRVTSPYGNRIHPIRHTKEFHKGIDLQASMNTPIYATADGIVEWASMHKKSGYGKLIIIQHNYGFKSVFGHLNKIVVKTREFVKKGQLIGYSGNTGLSSGPHLHYELRYFYQTLNPLYFMKWSMENYNEIFEKVKNVPWSSIIEATSNVRIINPTQTVTLSKEEEKKLHKK